MPETHETPLLHGRVVVGYDGSKAAERALEHAIDAAARRETGLEILCGDPWTAPAPAGEGLSAAGYQSRYRATRELLDAAADRARKLAPGLSSIVPTVTSEDAAQALVNCGRSASLTVVGTRGHGGFAGLLLGSVSLRLAAHSEGPVMVVRGDEDLERAPRGVVLVGVQANTERAAARFGFEEAARRGAMLRALHAWHYPSLPAGLTVMETQQMDRELEDARKAGTSVSRYAVSSLREEFPQVQVTADHETASASAALVEASKSADLVVLTARRNPHRVGMHLGPVAHAVLHHAHCPVVLIPSV